MKRLNLMAARITAGYTTQLAFVNALNDDGIDVSINEYANIESGRNKEVGLGIGFIIAKKLNKLSDIETLFLPLPTYKIRPNNKTENCATREAG